MTNYVRRLVYVDDNGTVKINALLWPFLFAIAIYGLGFLVGSGWSGVNSSSLFQAFYAIHPFLPRVWGAFALAAGLCATGLVVLRKMHLGDIAAMFGFMVWLFAAFVYVINGYWLVLLTVTGPNLYFWVFYYFRLRWYKRQKKSGLLVDAG